MHHGTCVTHVPCCMLGSLTSGFLWSRWWGQRSRHSWCMCNPHVQHSTQHYMNSVVGGYSTYHCMNSIKERTSSLPLHSIIWEAIMKPKQQNAGMIRWLVLSPQFVGSHTTIRNQSMGGQSTWTFAVPQPPLPPSSHESSHRQVYRAQNHICRCDPLSYHNINSINRHSVTGKTFDPALHKLDNEDTQHPAT